jgi:DNA-binding NarL/FixJ family response regulator
MAMLVGMIRVAILDRHPAVRSGVEAAVLAAHPDLATAGTAARSPELFTLLYRTDPDVLLLDELGPVWRVRTDAPRTRIVLYTASVTPALVVAATLAGVDGIVDKATDTRELLDAIRDVAAGERRLPSVTARTQASAAARLDAHDRPLFAMRLAGTTPREIAASAGLTLAALNARIQAIVAQLALRAGFAY